MSRSTNEGRGDSGIRGTLGPPTAKAPIIASLIRVPCHLRRVVRYAVQHPSVGRGEREQSTRVRRGRRRARRRGEGSRHLSPPTPSSSPQPLRWAGGRAGNSAMDPPRGGQRPSSPTTSTVSPPTSPARPLVRPVGLRARGRGRLGRCGAGFSVRVPYASRFHGALRPSSPPQSSLPANPRFIVHARRLAVPALQIAGRGTRVALVADAWWGGLGAACGDAGGASNVRFGCMRRRLLALPPFRPWGWCGGRPADSVPSFTSLSGDVRVHGCCRSWTWMPIV
jgi:hypothetical protein